MIKKVANCSTGSAYIASHLMIMYVFYLCLPSVLGDYFDEILMEIPTTDSTYISCYI